MKLVTTILALSLVICSYSQKIKVNGFNRDFEKYRNAENFDYIHEDFDTTKLTWIATLTIQFDTVVPGMIGECFKELKEKSNRFGANSFMVEESDIYTTTEEKFIKISCYWNRMEHRAENLSLFKDTKVYLVGFLGYHSSIDGYDVTIDGETLLVGELSYYEYEYEAGDKVHLRLGSKSRGAEKYIYMEAKEYPKFYYFTLVKGSYKNAWIDEYSPSFGIYLTKILRKAS